VRAYFLPFATRVDAEHLDVAGSRSGETLEQIERRRLAGAVGAEECEHLASAISKSRSRPPTASNASRPWP
jgi:hypothetical protein